jgi:hypothetical protein
MFFFTPFAQPQTGGQPLTGESDILGVEDAYDTINEIVSKVKENSARLNSIDANNNGRADTTDDLQNSTTNYVQLFQSGLL